MPVRLVAGWLALVTCLTAIAADPLPGTQPLTESGDLASKMVDGIDRFLLEELAASVNRRARHWSRDTSSPQKYNASVAANRARLAKIIGAADPRLEAAGLEIIAPSTGSHVAGNGDGFIALGVRWNVLPGVTGEGLMLTNPGERVANVVVLADADQTPEMLCGLAPGLPPEAQIARRLAESGCNVIVPALIDRADTLSRGAGGTRPTNQPHREFIYRQAFEMGRHVIGYEVQKVLALVDYFASEHSNAKNVPIAMFGYGEGGLIALHAAALDPRIASVCVSGHFAPRESVWQEPIYRNVFALLDEFGDAELATLVAPRTLIVEACRGPEIAGPPTPREGASGAAPGKLTTPDVAEVRREVQRAAKLYSGWQPRLVESESGFGPAGTAEAVDALLGSVKTGTKLAPLGKSPVEERKDFDPSPRLKRQFDELIDYTQRLLLDAEYTRRSFMSKADRGSRSVDKWQATTKSYRDYFSNEVIGRFERELLPANPRTRQVYDEPDFVGYEVMLDVFPNVFAYGILLVPKGMKEGERRPVVVCQHGLEGRPQFLADPKVQNDSYNQYAVRLAKRGFITYSPQNPYIFGDRFRTLQRKANPLKKTLFSIIVPQHQQTVDWLASLPMVDPERIAFYGLSYGGKTAMRVPALVHRYCLSICSADFNEWIWKNTSARSPYSYLNSGEYEIFEFDLGNTFNYAEMAGLIAPRPFMVERGHHDGVAPDEWVAYEFAKVKRLYVDLGIGDRAEIEFFDGPHTIHGVGTFDFLHRHLKWPAPRTTSR